MKALLVIDVQNDFLPGGSLPVPEGDRIIPVINQLMPEFKLGFATRDWHPVNHVSFADSHPEKQVGEVISQEGIDQLLWPQHCIQNTPGADFPEQLLTAGLTAIIDKGTDSKIDSYSGFFDNANLKKTPLDDILKNYQVTEIHLCGLATDYCVKFTAFDAVKLGYQTKLITAGCRGVDLIPGDVDKALDDMKNAGVIIE